MTPSPLMSRETSGRRQLRPEGWKSVWIALKRQARAYETRCIAARFA
jgi:hypothetical protein